MISDEMELVDQDSKFSGGFADVYQATYQGRAVVIKSLRLDSGDLTKLKKVSPCDCISTSTELTSTKLFYREVLYWRPLSHANVVPFLGAAAFPKPFSLVSPWMENGNINQFLRVHPTENRMFFVSVAYIICVGF
jgi:serine/threonine protein kinase